MNRIKMITLSVGLLLFVVNMPCAACWDDDDDDWYDYWDNDWWDDDDDYAWWIELPEVVITPDNNDDDHNSTDDDDNDWWRRDYDDWDDNDNYDDDNWGEDDIVIGYNEKSDTPDKDDSKTKAYLQQSCQLCCVPAVMANIKMYAEKLTLEQAERLQKEYIAKFKEKYGADIENVGIKSNEIRTFMNECGFRTLSCAINSISSCIDVGRQVFVYVDIESADGKKYGHALNIIDYNRDGNGNVISYECINPNSGKVETHSPEEFTHPINVYTIIIK